MLHKSIKTYSSSDRISNLDIFKEFQQKSDFKLRRELYIKLVHGFCTAIKNDVINNNKTSFTLPYLGTFTFMQLLFEDLIETGERPYVDLAKKMQYWRSQEEEFSKEIDNGIFYTNMPKVKTLWIKPSNMTTANKDKARCYAVRFDRTILRNIHKKFRAGDITLKVYNTIGV